MSFVFLGQLSGKTFSLVSRPPWMPLGHKYSFYVPRSKRHKQHAFYAQLHCPAQTTLAGSLDLYTYTSGRWLRDDKLQCDSRYVSFDFSALCNRVIELCPGAASIASCDKKEGGFNRVFNFTTDNGHRVVARVPFSIAGPSRLTTNSEVATIRYLQTKTSIPIPNILDWRDDASNAIGSEYIIMEYATGVQLHQRWPSMAGNQQVRCIEAIYQKAKQMVDIKFPAYGSLYFIDSALETASKRRLDERFCIGPHCGAAYWSSRVGEPRHYHKTKPNQGPWSNFTAYCDGLIGADLSRIPPSDSVPKIGRSYDGSVNEHHRLLEFGRAVIKKMSEDQRIQNTAAPTLLHPDLHKRNIFVSNDDPTIITSIIDWQSSAIEPAFWYVDEIPDFARPVAHNGQLEPRSELCTKAFDACTQFLVPKLAGPRLMDESMFRPFRYCHRTWKDGAVAFRNELIETARHWKDLGLPGSCPFPLPTPEELVAHRKEYQRFEAAQNLKNDLSNLLNTATDGWVPPEDWEATKLAHRELFDGMLQAVLNNENPDDGEPIKTEADLRAIWPFDI